MGLCARVESVFYAVEEFRAARRNARLSVKASAYAASQNLNCTRYLSHSRAHTSLYTTVAPREKRLIPDGKKRPTVYHQHYTK